MFARPEVMAAWDKAESLLRECVIQMLKFNAASYDEEADDADKQLTRLVQMTRRNAA